MSLAFKYTEVSFTRSRRFSTKIPLAKGTYCAREFKKPFGQNQGKYLSTGTKFVLEEKEEKEDGKIGAFSCMSL